MVKLNAGVCILRTLEPADAASMALHANDSRIWNNVRDYFPQPYTLDDAVAFIEQESAKTHPNNLGIIYEGQCIGVIGFYPMQDVYRLTADFGYWIGADFWGKGIVSAAVPATRDYIFSTFDTVRLQSSVFAFNKASMRVLEKCGFTLDCVARYGVVKNGQLVDEYRYSCLRPGL